MTTIAVNHECMAADRHYSVDGVGFSAPKLWVNDGSVWGSAGKSGDWNLFQRFILGQAKDPPVLDEETFAAIRLSPEGIFYYDYSSYPVRMNDRFFAIGSGQLAAITLMNEGYSPRSSVEAIAKVAETTREPVDCISLTDAVVLASKIRKRRAA